MLKQLSINVAAGAASSTVAVVAGIVATPLYLSLLGKESYGVIGFFITIQSALLVLDGGLALTAARLVAQASESQNGSTADLLHGLARVTWSTALAVAFVIGLLASSLTSRWLNLTELEPNYVSQALVIAGIAIGARWPLGFYQSVLMGRQMMVKLSAITIIMTSIATGGALAVMAWVTPDLRVLFGWLAGTTLVQVLWCRAVAIRVIGHGCFPPPGDVWRFFRRSAAAGWLGLVGLLLMQVDKLVLSQVLPIELFGYYVIATLVAGTLYALVTPVFNALYPRFATLVREQDRLQLQQLYRNSSHAVAALLFPIAAVLASFAGSILLLWTGDAALASAASSAICLLSLGTALHGIMFVPYALKLAYGASRLALAISMALLVVMLPTTIFMALRWGGPGAAAAWLMLNILYVLVGSIITHWVLMPGLGYRWLIWDVAPPAIVSLSAAWATSRWTLGQAWSSLERVEAGALLVILCWFVLVCASTRLRDAFRSLIKGTRWGLN